jgi:hypothetical protein
VDFSSFLPHGEVLQWNCDIPLTVIQRGLSERGPNTTAPELESLETLWRSLQADLAGRSKYGKLITAEGIDHMIPLKDPLIVIESIREVSDQAMARTGKFGARESRNIIVNEKGPPSWKTCLPTFD